MSSAPFLLATLDAAHDFASFHCDSDFNRHLREQASQDIRRRVAACFLALADGQPAAAFCTLASASLFLADLPASDNKKLPRCPTVPAVRIGRLAVDHEFKGQGLGGALLALFLPSATAQHSRSSSLTKNLAMFAMGHDYKALPCFLPDSRSA